jgi:hypothetical protein
LAQIDQLATLRAKRAITVPGIPHDYFAALRAVHDRLLHDSSSKLRYPNNPNNKSALSSAARGKKAYRSTLDPPLFPSATLRSAAAISL